MKNILYFSWAQKGNCHDEEILDALVLGLPSIGTMEVFHPSPDEAKDVIDKSRHNTVLLIMDTFLHDNDIDGGTKLYKELQQQTFPHPIVLLTYKTKENLWMTLREQDLYRQRRDAENNPEEFLDALKERYPTIKQLWI